MKKRIITAVVGAPILALSIIFNNKPFPFFAIIMLLVSIFSLKEFYDMVRKINNSNPNYTIGYIAAGLMIILSILHGEYRPVILGIIIIILLIYMLKTEDFKIGINNFAWTITGIVYLGFLPSYLVSLGNIDNGNLIIIWTIVNVFAIDIFAFFTGSAFGKTHFAPRISPHKTIAGLIGGIVGELLCGLILNSIFNLGFGIFQLIGLICIIYTCAIFGDLIESYIKRAANVKDASNLLPGHGGIMDRFDSLFLTGFAVYYFILFFV